MGREQHSVLSTRIAECQAQVSSMPYFCTREIWAGMLLSRAPFVLFIHLKSFFFQAAVPRCAVSLNWVALIV